MGTVASKEHSPLFVVGWKREKSGGDEIIAAESSDGGFNMSFTSS
jgi:hypothetical protein